MLFNMAHADLRSLACKLRDVPTWHADASEAAAFVDARPIVHTRARFALVDVDLAARPHEAGATVAAVRAWRVDTDSVVFAGGA